MAFVKVASRKVYSVQPTIKILPPQRGYVTAFLAGADAKGWGHYDVLVDKKVGKLRIQAGDTFKVSKRNQIAGRAIVLEVSEMLGFAVLSGTEIPGREVEPGVYEFDMADAVFPEGSK